MGDYYEGKFDDKPLSLLSIKEHRIKRGMSQLKLSQATHLFVPQNVISELESGRRQLTGYTIPHLCNVFKVGKEDLILGNKLAMKGVKLEDRFKAIKAVANDTDLFIAGKGIARAQKLDKRLDFGNRDSLGVRLSDEEVEARKDAGDMTIERDSFGRKRTKKEIKVRRKEAEKKRAEKRVEKRREDFDLQTSLDRDQFGRKLTEKQIAEKTRIANKGIDDSDDMTLADLMEGTEDEKFLAKLNALLEKGEQRRKG
ncbi:hypothetical protein ES703_79868 [subsurface metagenome]